MRRAVLMLVTAVVVFGGIGVALALALRSSGQNALSPFAATVRAGKLSISIPPGFEDSAIRGGIYRTGTRPPVIGHMLTDFRLPDPETPWQMQDRWSTPNGSGPPSNVVALMLQEDLAIGPAPIDDLQLPLSPSQPWHREHFANGRIGGYRYGWLRFDDMDYEVIYWIGPEAPAKDRAAVLEALRSIRPR